MGGIEGTVGLILKVPSEGMEVMKCGAAVERVRLATSAQSSPVFCEMAAR